MGARYDTIGTTYARHRRPDPRIAERIHAALGGATSILNVGAGTGSYEPSDRRVIAIEPSAVMVAQRSDAGAPVVRAASEQLPCRDRSVDVVLAILTIHHWSDARRGLAECLRVARDAVVLVTWDPDSDGFWLTNDYLPSLLAEDRRIFPSMRDLEDVLGAITSTPVPVPADCVDGFLGAYWRRPDAYLDPDIRASISTFARLDRADPVWSRLSTDLRSGAWAARYASLLSRTELDVGYRLVVASCQA